jgi:Ring finger domain
VVVIITRPPEIIACLKLVVHNRDVFIIFDSHARPSHPDGAGFILNTSIHHTAVRLNEILPVDNRLLDDGNLQWQAQLLANYSGHIFVSRGLDNGHAHLKQTIVESSLAILALRAEVLDLKSQNSTLTSDTERLEADMEQMEDDHCEELKRILQSSRNHDFDPYRTASASIQSSNKVAGLRVTLHHSDMSHGSSHHIDKNSWSSASSSNTRHPPNLNDDFVLAEQMQFECLDSDRHNAEAAAQRQRQFDEEDRYLRAQMEELANNTQRQFKCGVCLDKQPEDSVARLEPCGHCFCRSCIKGYVSSRLAENRYPMLCPVCIAERGVGDPGGASHKCSLLRHT